MKRQSKTDLARVDAMTEGEVRRNALADPDAEPTDAAFWADAELREPPAKKVPVNIRIAPDVLAFFKEAGPGYQGRINQVLENYVQHKAKRTRART